jgi:hypothetical protein
MGAVKALTDDGLFIGHRPPFLKCYGPGRRRGSGEPDGLGVLRIVDRPRRRASFEIG